MPRDRRDSIGAIAANPQLLNEGQVRGDGNRAVADRRSDRTEEGTERVKDVWSRDAKED